MRISGLAHVASAASRPSAVVISAATKDTARASGGLDCCRGLGQGIGLPGYDGDQRAFLCQCLSAGAAHAAAATRHEGSPPLNP